MRVKQWTNKVYMKYCIVRECMAFGLSLLKYNASVDTDNDLYKMQYTLLRENHVIEKGMSMRSPHKGFGQQKVLALLSRLFLYNERYGEEDKNFLLYPLSTVKRYICYTETSGVQIPEIKELFDKLLLQVGMKDSDLVLSAGIMKESQKHIQEQCDNGFEALLRSRHSIRYYTSQVPTMDVINKALELAQRTPSACNRQAWHTHVYLEDQSHRLLKMQQGCRGFEDEIHCSVLVTADMKGFLAYEPYQCYVDGGLYAMNLINAFHSLGLGTIPLSCGFYHKKLESIKQAFNIPENEVPIVIIGVGELLEQFNVAESTRKDITKTNTYHS